MQLHGNARTTPYIRREMVRRVRERAEPVTETADHLSACRLERFTSGWIDTSEKVRPGCSIDQAGRRAVRTQQALEL